MFEEGGVRRSRPLPLLRKCWSIAQVAVVNSRGELICFYTLSLLFTLSTPLVMQQTTHFHYNQLSFLPKCMWRTSKHLRPLFKMKLALATLSYMLVIHLKGSNLLLGTTVAVIALQAGVVLMICTDRGTLVTLSVRKQWHWTSAAGVVKLLGQCVWEGAKQD